MRRRERQQAEQVERRQRIGRGQILDPRDERLVTHLDRQHQHLVQRVHDRDLEQRRRATRERIDLLRLVQRHHFLLHADLVVLILLLQQLHLRLDGAHRGHRLELALGDREQQAADRHGQQDDRDAEVANHAEQPVEIIEDRLLDDPEPAPVDRVIELGDTAGLVGVAIEQADFLRASEEARDLRDRLARCDLLGLERVVGLVRLVGAGAELAVERLTLVGDERGQPVFVGEAEPAAGRRELLRGLVDVLVVRTVMRAAIVDRHRPDMDRHRRRILRDADAVDEAVGSDGDGSGAGVEDGLANREHVILVDRDLDAEALAGGVGRVERDRRGRRQRGRARGRPDGVGSGRGQALRAPAEACEIRVGRAGGRQQADRRRVLRDGLVIALEHEIVDPRALQVDGAGHAGRLDADARGAGDHRVAIADRGGAVRGRIGGGVGDRLGLAALDLRDRRIRGREELALDQRPSEQDQRRDHREQHEILLVVFHRAASFSFLSISGTGSGPYPPHGWQRAIRFAANQPPLSAP